MAVANDAVMQAAKATIGRAIDEIVTAGSAMEVQPSGTLPFDDAADKVAAVEAALDRRASTKSKQSTGASFRTSRRCASPWPRSWSSTTRPGVSRGLGITRQSKRARSTRYANPRKPRFEGPF